jgi:hypothetical protein
LKPSGLRAVFPIPGKETDEPRLDRPAAGHAGRAHPQNARLAAHARVRVTRWIRERTEGTIEIEDAPLYKALHRLERAGCVSAEWGLSENNRRARYYRLTPAGRQRLKAEESAWRRYAAAVFRVLEPA